ncbi:MAG: MinD/ParA family protein [bacterium]|nr:MinD/ParA family protein [bacterium]
MGKSVVTANTAIALAGLGYRTIAADLDLGGSNLHSFLGMPNKYPGIGDFVKQENKELTDYLVPTTVQNLQFLPGDGITPFMANITFHQKQRLMMSLKKLPADFILMDLGAGSSYNVLDFFALAHRGFLVAVPESPSILSMLGFLKNYIFRYIERAAAKNKRVRERLNRLYHHREADRQLTVQTIREEVRQLDPDTDRVIGKICDAIRPGIIFNMGGHPDEMRLIKQFDHGLQNGLSLEADYLGFIFSDPHVRLSVKHREPLLLEFPGCMAAKEILQVARRIIKFQARPVPDSAQLLMDSTRTFYEQHSSVAAQTGGGG